MITDSIGNYLKKIRNAILANHRMKYDSVTKSSVIKSLTRASKPGLRKYSSCSDLPRVLNGLGIAIVSTSKGVMTDKKARDLNVGGEVLCYIY